MVGACSSHEEDEKFLNKIWLESLKGRENLEDLGEE
jgi:hypothetical protein